MHLALRYKIFHQNMVVLKTCLSLMNLKCHNPLKQNTNDRCCSVEEQFGRECCSKNYCLYLIKAPMLSLLILQLDMLNTCCSGIFKNLIRFATSGVLLWLSVSSQHPIWFIINLEFQVFNLIKDKKIQPKYY